MPSACTLQLTRSQRIPGVLNAVSNLDEIAARAEESAAHSWEYGAVSHALLEIYDPSVSPFFGAYNSLEEIGDDTIRNARGLKFAKRFIRTDQSTLIDGEGKNPSSLWPYQADSALETGSAADPASLGPAAILLGKLDKAYEEAAARQQQVLIKQTPRYQNGAISHRENIAELWSDFGYMAPPFLALSTFLSRDEALFEAAVRQCLLQKEILQDEASGFWKHVVGPEKPDPGLWSTGNGWTVCGQVRVYALVCRFQKIRPEVLPDDLKKALEKSICEIISAAVASERAPNGLLRNYINDASSFGESAGTAAIVSAIFRMASLEPTLVSKDQILWAESTAEIVLANVVEDGSLTNVVNPMKPRDPEPRSVSAEGQAFALHMIAAQQEHRAQFKRVGED